MDKKDQLWEEKLVYEGKWLIFKTIRFMTKQKECIWEFVERPKKASSIGGVEVIPIIKRKNQPDQLLIIASYRIPIQKYILEFPAGIMDDGDVIDNALRELKEETGFQAQFVWKYREMQQVSYIDPWKSTENTCYIFVTIDGNAPENQCPVQDLELEEDIKVHFVDLDEKLVSSLQDLAQANQYEIQASLWTFALGQSLNYLQNKQQDQEN